MPSFKKKFANYCQEFLVEEFNRRKSRNPSYSMRAFARDIGIAKTNVSAVINGLRRLSKTNISILAENLKLDAETLKRFQEDLGLAAEEKMQSQKEWHFMAVLNLTNHPDNKFSPEWVAATLAITIEKAEKTLNELVQSGLIQNVDNKIMKIESESL